MLRWKKQLCFQGDVFGSIILDLYLNLCDSYVVSWNVSWNVSCIFAGFSREGFGFHLSTHVLILGMTSLCKNHRGRYAVLEVHLEVGPSRNFISGQVEDPL